MASKKRADSPRPSREERRQQLLDAAVKAIREVGASASMEQIAAEGGVTKPILYRHFGDRDGLVAAIGEHYGTLLLGRIGDTLDADTPDDDLLWRTIDAYLAFLEADPELYSFLMRQTTPADATQSVSGLIDVIGRQVAIVIGDRLRAQGLDAGGAQPMAFGIVGMVHSSGDWWIRNRTMSREALTTYLAGLLWNGFSGLAVPDPAGQGAGTGTPLH
jgi:AcrR family transcriptional regulator